MRAPLGFIGCGHMGGAMAQRLLEGGVDLVVHDVDPDRLTPLIERGGKVAHSAREVADQAAIVFTSLPSQDASRFVAQGVAEGKAIRIYVETSTIGQSTIVEIAECLRPGNVTVLDMPVSGGPSWAREGRLTAILSGPETAREEIAPALACIAGRVLVVGDVAGLAQVAKVVNNALSLTGMMIACEAIVAGVKAGIDATQLIEVVNAGTGRNSATVDKFPKAVLPRTFNYGGPVSLGIKDLELYLDLARATQSDAPVGQAVAQVWRKVVDAIGENSDLTEMVRYFEKTAGVEVAGRPSQ